MGIVCCKQELQTETKDQTNATKPNTAGYLCEEIKSQFQICPIKKKQKLKHRRNFKRKNWKKQRPIISSPKLLNPKYLTGEKWHNVILTIPEPKIKTRTPVPPPRKKRKSQPSLLNTKEKSVLRHCACNSKFCENNGSDLSRVSKFCSSETDLCRDMEDGVDCSVNSTGFIKKSFSCWDISDLNICSGEKYNKSLRIRAENEEDCLICYINELKNLLEELNEKSNNKISREARDDFELNYNGWNKNDEQKEEAGKDVNEVEAGEKEEVKVFEINEEKLKETLEKFCIQCYLNKTQTHVEERDITSLKITNENNFRSFQTGDNNNFSLVNKNSLVKINPEGFMHENVRRVFPNLELLQEGKSFQKSHRRFSIISEQSLSKVYKPRCSLDKFECIFCCLNNKNRTKKNGSLHEIYSKLLKYEDNDNIFKYDNTNERHKYTIGNKQDAGERNEDKTEIRDEKLRRINNTNNTQGFLEQFKNLNSCKRNHLNLCHYMCWECFFVYLQILYLFKKCNLSGLGCLKNQSFDESHSALDEIRNSELMKGLKIEYIRMIVNCLTKLNNIYIKYKNTFIVCSFCSNFMHNTSNIVNIQNNEENIDSQRSSTFEETASVFFGRSEKMENVQEYMDLLDTINQKNRESDASMSNIKLDLDEANNNVATNTRRESKSVTPDQDVQEDKSLSGSTMSEFKQIVENKVSEINIVPNNSLTKDKTILNKQYVNSKKFALDRNLRDEITTPDVVQSSTEGETRPDKMNVKTKFPSGQHCHTKSKNHMQKLLQKFENIADPIESERRKNKFEKLQKELNSNKINTTVSYNNKSENSHETTSQVSNQSVNSVQEKTEFYSEEDNLINEDNDTKRNQIEKKDTIASFEFEKPLVDDNANIISESIPDSNMSNLISIENNGMDKKKDVDEHPTKCFMKRNSVKRRSRYKLSSAGSDRESAGQVDRESRRSSITDSLYELEASLLEMLQKSCEINFDDLEY